MTWVLVMMGAGLGAPARWLVDRGVQARNDSVFPWGTFVINVSGSLLLGAFARGASDSVYALLGTGFCGGFTTFSTFSYETFRLLEDGANRIAARNVVASVLLGLLASFAGWYAADALLGGAAT